ncbi:MAG TPA: chromosome segregation protein SMC [Pirellulales bacterium]|nr:chromosome segregation protein SMC [Pirellulales bacterium]
MLKALELVGFKSFADKTRFDFPSGITAVVGPNGSGKSNVVDAIKWVLGEQSVKSLRGKEMADVIFNGSASRAPLNYAETTLTLDNSTRRLPIDTAEVLVTRRVYRNGEGEYMLNRQPCRLRDIRELFSGTGVATEAYSVIEQGKVDVLLQSSPRDRRLIFEEAAGISRFKAKKVESLRRLERVEQNLLRLGDIVAEVEHRLRQVRLQAGKARRYKEYSDRLQQLRTHVGLADWRQLSARIAEMERELLALTLERNQTADAAQQSETAAALGETQLAATAEKIRATEARSAQIREGIATREAALDHHRQRTAELDKEADRLRRQLSAVNVRAGSLEQQLHETAAQLSAAESDYAQVAANASAEDRRLADVTSRLATLRREGEASRDAYLAEMRRTAQCESETSSQTARLESARVRRQREEQRQQELQAARNTLETDLAAFREGESALSASIAQLDQVIKAARDEAAGLAQRQAQQQREIAQVREQLTAARERASVLEEFQRRREGYSEAVKTVLERAGIPGGPFENVQGVVAELLQVNFEMAPLIEVALGGRAQHIVVSTLDELILSMQKDLQRFPSQVTFTPIDAPEHRSATRDVDLRGQTGVLGRADDFVRTSAPFVPLAVRLLGRTWIVDTLERATTLAAAHAGLNFITLAGEARFADETLSFGASAPAAGLISRQSELAVLADQIKRFESSLAEQSRLAAECGAELNAANRRRGEAEHERSQLVAQRSELQSRIKASGERATQLADEQRRSQLDLATIAETLATIDAALVTLRERAAASRAVQAELETHAAELAEKVADEDAARSAIEAAVATVKIELGKSEERLANLRLRARQLEQDQRERRRTVAEVSAELARAIERRTASDRVLLDTESELALLYLNKEGAFAELATLAAREETQRTERAAHLADVQRQRARAHDLEEKMHGHELATHEIRHARTTVADRLREDYGLDLAAAEEPQTIEETRRREEIDAEIAELRRKIAHIGNVNLDALAEVEELEGRFAHLSAQHRDLSEAKQSLVEIIDRINADSRRLFAETLARVRVNFQALFRKLFGGGQADILIDEGADMLESGIEIMARPPGKEPRSISLLSGGEKTLTCVALLLAIFQYRPSPFCVLDEVDAALDEANIERFIGVLQEFLAWTQFIVVTHSKKTMTCASTLYGVTMQESGVSKRVAVRFEDITAEGKLAPAADTAASDDETQAA